MKEKIAVLKRMLDESNYTVALCGSGMLTDGGVRGIKIQTGPMPIGESLRRFPGVHFYKRLLQYKAGAVLSLL